MNKIKYQQNGSYKSRKSLKAVLVHATSRPNLAFKECLVVVTAQICGSPPKKRLSLNNWPVEMVPLHVRFSAILRFPTRAGSFGAFWSLAVFQLTRSDWVVK